MTRSTRQHLSAVRRIDADVVRAQLGIVREPPRPAELVLVRRPSGPRS